MKKALCSMALTALLIMDMQAFAAPPPGRAHYSGHHGRHGGYGGTRVGIYYGPGFGYWGAWNYGWGGYGVPYPYAYPYAGAYPYAYSPVVINAPPVALSYIQQERVAEAAVPAVSAVNYWYYCYQPAGYFPYVQNCDQPWVKVTPQNPGNQQ